MNTVTLPRSVVEQALDMFERGRFANKDVDELEALCDVLRAVLEQPQVEQEPVAYYVMNGAALFQLFRSKSQADALAYDLQKRHDLSGSLAQFHVVPLYTHPQNLNCKSNQARLATLWGYEKPQPPRQPLTDEAVRKLIPPWAAWKYEVGHDEAIRFARAIEAAHRIGGEA